MPTGARFVFEPFELDPATHPDLWHSRRGVTVVVRAIASALRAKTCAVLEALIP